MSRPSLIDRLPKRALAVLAQAGRLPEPARIYHYAGAADATWFEVADVLLDALSARTGAARPALTGIATAAWKATLRLL